MLQKFKVKLYVNVQYKIMLEFEGILKGICKNPVLLGPAILTLDDMIANIGDDIEQLKKKEIKDND